MYRRIYDILEKQGKVKTAVILNGAAAGSRCMAADGQCISMEGSCADWGKFAEEIIACDTTKKLQIGDTQLLVEIFQKNPRLVILGGGHVSCPVAHIGSMLGFSVTVMDDREEFLTKERFPDAKELIRGTFEELEEKIPAYENAYYVIVTRGHAGDAACVRRILTRPYVYLGMIGSKTKVKLTHEKLLSEGFTPEQLATIHAPIGLPIGGQTPEEIAVSIMAEIVQVKNKKYAAYTDEKVEEQIRLGARGVMMTIVEKHGSSPRDVGSKMLLSEDGNAYGSIGGGSVEFEALKHAGQVRGTEVCSYNLSMSDERNLGMICGGNVQVLFEKI